MAPIVHGLEDKYKSQVNFAYLDIDDENTQIFQDTLEYYYQPHLFLLDADGNVIQQWIGYVRQEELETALMDALE